MNDNAARERPARIMVPVCLVAALALALRLLHVYFTQRANPLAPALQLDAATYDRWARALAAGGDPGPTTLMQSPVYPWFVSLLYRVFGPSLAAVRVAQALLGTATCVLVALVTRRLFSSLAAAVVAGLVAALYAPFIFYEGMILPATLIVFLNALFLSIACAGGKPGARRLLAAGIVLGAAVAANPPTLLIAPFALAHLAYASRGDDGGVSGEIAGDARSSSRAPFVRAAAVATAGFAIAAAPLAVRNYLCADEFIPLTTGGGVNFYIGNGPGANGYYSVPVYRGTPLGGTPEDQARMTALVAERETGARLSQSGVSRFWLGAALASIRDDPGAWTSLLWRKFQFFWNAYERANVENFYFHRRFPGVLRLPLLTFGLVAPLALLGVFLTRGRRRRLWLLYGGILAYLATALAFYVLARYRLPALPFLIPFAAAAAVDLFTLARERRRAEFALAMAALAAMAFFANMKVARDTPTGVAAQFVRLGAVYGSRGDLSRAEEAFREALRRDPASEAAKLGLSRISAERRGAADPLR